MSCTPRQITLVVSFGLIVALVIGNPKLHRVSFSQDRPLSLSTYRGLRSSDGKVVFNLNGHFNHFAGTVNLRATTIRSPRRHAVSSPIRRADSSNLQAHRNSFRSLTRYSLTAAQGQNPAPIEDGGNTGYDYYFTQGEMSKGDGTVLVNASYENDTSVSQNLVVVTIHGVTLTFNLNTLEVGPVSDADLDALNDWLATEDGHLVQQTGVALVQQGHQEPDNEALLIYYLISLIVDTDSPGQAALKIVNQRDRSVALHHAQSVSGNRPSNGSNNLDRCSLSSQDTDEGVFSRDSASVAAPQCSGCCGPGCLCIFDRNGHDIYGALCLAHDQCVGQNGNRRLARPCLGLLARGIAFVISRWF